MDYKMDYEMNLELLKNKIDESDLILIGIGEQFEIGFSVLKNSEIYKIFLSKIEKEKLKEEDYAWVYPYLLPKAMNNSSIVSEIQIAYDNLKQMIDNKNYFIITMNMDDLIYQIGFKEDRIVAPFGTYHFLQCDNGCSEELSESKKISEFIINSIENDKCKLVDINQPICNKCKDHLVFNNVNAKKYIESGYMDQWKKYTSWIQGIMNRKVCILELGVILNYPSMIRFPFEKMAFFNQKSTFIRVNGILPQLTEELSGKGISIPENPVTLLRKEIVNKE